MEYCLDGTGAAGAIEKSPAPATPSAALEHLVRRLLTAAPVEQDQRRPFAARQAQGSLPIMRRQQSIALRSECFQQQTDNVRLIIHHKDRLLADACLTQLINGG